LTKHHYEAVGWRSSALDGNKPKEVTIQAVGSKHTIESQKAPNEEKTKMKKKNIM